MSFAYPKSIPFGQEPKEFIFKESSGLYDYNQYFDATYIYRKGNPFHQLLRLEVTEDNIKNILLIPQKLSAKGKVYTIFNTLTGQNMKLYNGKISWNSKGAATQSFVYFMQEKGIKNFQSEDFHLLVKNGLIEVRELT